MIFWTVAVPRQLTLWFFTSRLSHTYLWEATNRRLLDINQHVDTGWTYAMTLTAELPVRHNESSTNSSTV